uniref:Uncharacterized protein n=1 Tax=Panagrolaimus sp. JU765 TaxID=591449 RepID=A0AC34QVT1_9BILA
MMIDKLTKRFRWKRPQLMYEKNFWESELREAGFCKLLMNGMYLWTAEKKWDLQVNPKLLPSHLENPRKFYREFLVDTVGVNHGGWFGRLEECPLALIFCALARFCRLTQTC